MIKVITVNKNLMVFTSLLFIVFTSILYSDYLVNDPILKRDDHLLVLPMKDVTSVGDYIDKVSNNTILDVQPVRDVTFWLNDQIHNLFGYSGFHLFNYLFFLFSIYLVYKLLTLLKFDHSIVFGSTLFYALHPIMVSSVGWISARKHSLALVFILLAIIEILKMKKLNWKVVLFYALSVFSHQIMVLFPIWIVVYSKIKKINIDKKIMTSLFFICVSALFLGVYKTFYLKMGNVTYEEFTLFDNISRFILSLGRSMILMVAPVSIAAAYFQGSIWNLLGIPLLILFLYFLYKDDKKKEHILWLVLCTSIMLPTYIAFVHETYLYLPLICFIIISATVIQSKQWHKNPKFKALISVYLLLLIIKTVDASQMWKSDLALWQYSFKNEGSPYNAIILSQKLLKHNERSALDLLEWGVESFNLLEHSDILNYYLQTIYTSSLPINKKIENYEKHYLEHETYKAYYALALVEGTYEQTNKGLTILGKALIPEKNYLPGSQGLLVLKSLKYICNNISGKEYLCETLKIRYK